MAYMNQDKKAVIAATLKQIMPVGFKYSLRVEHHSTIVMTIREGGMDFIGAAVAKLEKDARFARHDEIERSHLLRQVQYVQETGLIRVNVYSPHRHFEAGEELALIERIIACLNTGNWDKSNIQSDYVDVGHYITLNIGEWDKPYRYTGKASTQQAA